MKRFIFCIFCFIPFVIKAQTTRQGKPLDFTVDSSRKPLFYFHYKPVPENNYRWGFYHSEDIGKGKKRFMTTRLYVAGRNSDTVVSEDFRDSIGTYWVCLEATYPSGLKDTVCRKIRNNFSTDGGVIGASNVFTPDSAGKQKFNLRIENESSYHLIIFDRWGKKVFESKSKDDDWNGRVNNNGAYCPDGTYYYLLKYRFGEKKDDDPVLNGTVRLIW